MIGKKRKRTVSESIEEDEVILAEDEPKTFGADKFSRTSQSIESEKEVVVSAKKKPKTVRGHTLMGKSQEGECLQCVSTEEKAIPIAKNVETFYVDTFLKSLQGAECLQALKAFVQEAENELDAGCDVVGKFLAAGRSPEDILRAVNTTEKKNLTVPTLVFSAVRLIIMRILRDMPEQTVLAESACSFFIRAHLPIIHAMLSLGSESQQKNSALRLLSVVVTVSPELAQEVARNVTLSPPVLAILTRRPQRKGKTNVRTCFIHFLLSFLINGSGATCRLLLEKKGYLNSIIPGLVQDSADTVVLVLTTLREKVLENPAISKTVKVHVFNVPTVRSLLALYSWKGPRYIMINPGRKKKSALEIIQAEPDAEEKEMVAETAHELLLKLCTSTRHGIIFQDQSLGTSGVKHNPIMYGVLQGLERPWENKWMCELAVKLLKACPDLTRTVWPMMETFLAPRASQQWLDAVYFVEQILSGFDPEVSLKHHVTAFTIQQLCSLLLAFSTPLPVLKVVGMRGLEHSNVTVRNRTARLLCTMLSLIHRRLEVVQSWGMAIPTDVVTAFFIQHLPAPRLIYAAWGPSTGAGEGKEEAEEILPVPATGAHESAILELLLLYRQCCPQLLDAMEFGQEFGDLLPGVLALERDGEEAVARLQVNAVRLLLSVDNQAFAPDKSLFTDAGLLLFELLGCEDMEVCRDASSTLSSLFESTGLFEVARQELQVWLHCYQVVEPDRRAQVAHFLLDAVKDLSANVKLHAGHMHHAEEAAAMAVMAAHEAPGVIDMVEDILRDLMEKGHSKQRSSRLKCESLSLLLVVALHTDLNDVLTNFLSYVVVHLLHTQVSPALLLEVVRLNPDCLPEPLLQYLEGWAGAGNPLPLKKPFPAGSPTRHLSEKLLRPDSVERKPFAKANRVLESVVSGDDLLGLVGQAIFYATQLAAKGLLTPTVQLKCTDALKTLLLRAEDTGLLETCLEKVLCSPALVRGFDPLGTGDYKLLSQIVSSVVQFALSHQERLPKLTSLLEPLKDRFVTCLIRQNITAPITVDLESLMEAFQLSREDVLSLLKACSAVNWTGKSSGWGQLLIYLMHKAAKLRIGDLEGSTLRAVVDQLAKADLGEKMLVEQLEIALTEFLCSCPHLISSIPASFFESILTSGSSRVSTAQLLTFLIQHNLALRASFSNVVLAHQEEVIANQTLFPCLFAEYVNGAKAGERDEAFAQVCDVARGSYGGELNKFLKKPQKVKDWMLKYFPAVESLIKACFDISTFSKMKLSVFQNIRNMDSVNTLYLKTVERICTQVGASTKAELVGSLLDSTTKLTKEHQNPESLLHLTRMLSRCMTWASGELRNYSAFCDVALKFGLRCEDQFQCELLALLPDFCNLMVVDGADDPDTRTVFEKLISHSRFLDLVLGKSDSKNDILRLLLVLVKKAPSVMSEDHVPVLLGAYSASLSSADQLILQLLQTYESSGVALQSCQPYLWGEAAVNYFSLRNRAGPSLWNRPHAGQVLDLLDSSYIEWTVAKFPYERELQASAMVPADQDLYDPAFLLPLLSHILAPESPVPNYKVMQSGAVAVVLSALGSQSREMRAAACHVLTRFHRHLEGSRSAKLWLHFLEAVRGGVVKLSSTNDNGADAPEVPELSCIVAMFLARASLIISQPMHPMYLPLHNFVLAKPAMDLSIVPEFLVLFHSSTLDHKTHRHWILEVLRDGIRYWKDVALCLRCVLYKMIMDFYSSSLADTQTKVLCLAILESTVKIPKAAQLLVRGYSIIPWLTHAVSQLEGSEVALRAAMLDTVVTLVSSLKGGDWVMLPTLLVLLLPHVECTVSSVLKFLSALHSATEEHLSSLTRENVDSVVRTCGEVLGCVGDCEALLRYGTEFADTDPGVTDSESGRGLLRNTVCRWLKNLRESQIVAEGDL